MKIITTLSKKIKEKQELSDLPDDYIESIIVSILDTKLLEKLEEHPKVEKSKQYKQAIKDVRKVLHDTYGVFRLHPKKQEEYLKELEKNHDKTVTPEIIRIHEDLLRTHLSTKERLKDYEQIYETITKEVGDLKSVLDISAGINPVSLIYSKKPSEYIATELTQNDVNLLNKYFKIMKINGIAIQVDLLNVKKFPKTKVCFLFKVLDNLESLKRNESKNLLKKIPAEYIIVSFPKITISGKKLNTKRLIWFNKIVKNKKLLETKNEIFFIINNKKEL